MDLEFIILERNEEKGLKVLMTLTAYTSFLAKLTGIK